MQGAVEAPGLLSSNGGTNMKSSVFAVIDTGVVTNVVLAYDSDQKDPAFVWVDVSQMSPQPGIGWAYDGNQFSAPIQPPPPPVVAADLDQDTQLAINNMIIAQLVANNLIPAPKQTQQATPS
jgi:hypothetical protein